ncbi:hypothetical protein QFZ75_000048 [Streptomyces sp. V3I8]|uniref:DUF6197 family protein n=1 Tax=Streptomyces sp. V3I8 TaxID=3042279 RepID=UPI0027876435|nr:hypothetical protein [Streptomyces sp. V3I8]MDQ1033632.1 hypothetical protein [Streptomyces sp. V3I8]
MTAPASLSPTIPGPTTTAGPARDTALSLEARLAATDAAMTVRLDEAKVAYEVNTARPDTVVDLADVVTVPLTPTLQPTPAPADDLSPVGVAGLLERAHHRMQTSGWCAGSLTDENGAVCLLGAIRKEAGGNRGLEADAAAVVLDAIRRQFGDDVDSVPAFNDAHGSDRAPMRILADAARLADTRGL